MLPDLPRCQFGSRPRPWRHNAELIHYTSDIGSISSAPETALTRSIGSPQTWAAFGVQGMPLYGLETEATAFLGEGGQSALRLEAEYDLLLTQRWVLQPTAELNLYGRTDESRGIGSGLSDASVGLRLRYEISRQFAPYVGVSWSRAYGNSAELQRAEGEDTSEARLVAGIRFWF